MKTTKPEAAAAARIGAGLGQQKRAELAGLLRGCFARVEPWLQASKYVSAVASGLARRNGWTIAEQAGDRTPDKTQRLLSRAAWDTFAAMGLPGDLVFRAKGQLAIGICADAFTDGVWSDFACGDEVYGNSTELREFREDHGQGYVLRVRSTFHLVLAAGRAPVTCAQPPARWARASAAGRSAPPGPAPRAPAGMPGSGWPAPRPVTIC